MKILTKILAFVCDICPLCIMARRFPNSKFAASMARMEKFCPFCRAHKKIKQEKERHQ